MISVGLKRGLAAIAGAMALAALASPGYAKPPKPDTPPPAPATPQGANDTDWAVTWAASPEPAHSPEIVLSNQTIRQVVRVSMGGVGVRVRLSNDYSATPLTIGDAHLAFAGTGSAIQVPFDKVLMFGGRRTVTIPPYAHVLSDPVNLPVPNLQSLAISLYVPAGGSGPVTEDFFALQTAYIVPKDMTAAPDLPGATTITRRAIITGVEVFASKRSKVIVALGDSLTGGFGSTVDANHRWPDALAERLTARKGSIVSIVNAGIGGNRLLHDVIGPNALARFDRDVLAQPGVTHLIILEGINDLGFPGGRNLPAEEVSADDIIFAYKQLIARAHEHNIKVIGGTIPNFGPIPERPGYFTPAAEAKRQAINQWIRTGHGFDAVIDFEAAVRDPSNPTQMLPAYDSGDHLDLNDAGYKAMADAIDLRLFD